MKTAAASALALLAAGAPLGALASANGLLYECDAAQLASSNLCVFKATSSNTVGASPNRVDVTVAADGARQVADAAGTALAVTPVPWTQGARLIASAAALAEDDANFARIFEIIGPLRNVMMAGGWEGFFFVWFFFGSED
jgi:hypothetical protein